MNKLVLALTFLAAGAGAFHSARHHASQLQQQVQTANESWQTHTQQLAAAQSEQAALSERVRELKQTLAQIQPAAENALWSALQTNRADRLPPELRERLLEELGLNWRSSPDFIVVSKQAVRDIGMITIQHGKFTDSSAATLALTPQERGQVEAAMERLHADFKDWTISHTERSEPRDGVLAHYTVPNYPVASVTNNLVMEVFTAIGKERTELIMPSDGWKDVVGRGNIQEWMYWIGMIGMMNPHPTTMVLKRFSDGNKQLLKVQVNAAPWEDISKRNFPTALRPLFPNGWADVAEREGFELPSPPEKK